MTKRTIIGMLTPSSNTVLEPYSSAMLADLVPEVSVHFSRFRVTEISLGAQALGQFDEAPMIAAAELLKDAHADVIAWNGTSGGWLGIEADRALCRAITAATGVAATTSTLAMLDALAARDFTRYGLVTPYLDAVQEKIIATFAGEGLDCVTEAHLNDKGNFSFSEFDEARIAGLVRQAAKAAPQAIVVYCTNFRGAPIAAELERDCGIPIYDTVSLTIWQCLKICGLDPARVKGWGSLFDSDGG